MHLKVIQNNDDHQQALAHLLELMESDPLEGTAESDELDVLALLIEQYEEKSFPIDLPGPVEAIQFRMEQQGLSRKDLVPYFGSAPRVSEVLSGKRKLSLNMIRKLNLELGIPAEALLHEVGAEVPDKIQKWDSSVLKVMLERGYFEGARGKVQYIQEYATEWIQQFSQTVPSNAQFEPALLRSTAHQRNNDKIINELALWAWQAKVQKKASEDLVLGEYFQGTVDVDFMRRLAEESWADNGPIRAREFLNHYGIHLIIEPHLPKTYLDGAVMCDGQGRPIVALSLRYDRLDNFWFTLMHELAHVALHLDGDAVFIDDLDSKGELDAIEQEADALAAEALIPSKIWNDTVLLTEAGVLKLARKLHISPAIVAGRWRKESGSYRKYAKLIGRNQVRHQFSVLGSSYS